MLIRLLLLPPLDYVCARMATSLTKISTPENKKKKSFSFFFFLPFYPLLKREWFLDLLYTKRFSQTVCHVCAEFLCVIHSVHLDSDALHSHPISLLFFVYISLCSWSTRQTTKLFFLSHIYVMLKVIDGSEDLFKKIFFQLCSSRFFFLLSQFDLI